MIKTLVLQDGIYAEIVRLAGEFKGLEFAITLFGTDDTLHPEEYVAGIILPLRRAGEPGVAIVPTYFSKQNPHGSEMEIEYVHAGVCTKSDRACRLFLAAYSSGRRGGDRWHDLRHLGAYWRRLT